MSQRSAFVLRVRPNRIDDYVAAHRDVWPEMLGALRGAGIRNYTIFRDATSGDETYGGGRYLLDTVKGSDLGMQDGRLVLDFNFAYNPSCSYDPRWVCPLSPPANRLPVAIEAGERMTG